MSKVLKAISFLIIPLILIFLVDLDAHAQSSARQHLDELVAGRLGALILIISAIAGFFFLMTQGGVKNRERLMMGLFFFFIAAVIFTWRLLISSGVIEIMKHKPNYSYNLEMKNQTPFVTFFEFDRGSKEEEYV